MLWWFSQTWYTLYKPTNKLKKLNNHGVRMKTINLCNRLWTSPLISTRLNQYTHRCVDLMKFGLISMKIGTISYVLTSSFQDNICGRCKQESEHYYSAGYFYLPKMMGNASCLPSFSTKKIITTNISNSTLQYTG